MHIKRSIVMYKKGLILEGGAMRGMFTAGVIDVFMENDIVFDGAVGISAGATFGCNIKSKQPGRVVRYNKKYCKDPRYGTIKSLIKSGDLYENEFCYHEIPDKLDVIDRETFKDNPMEFYIGATDIRTGLCVFHLCSDCGSEDIEWMRASASMPFVSKPVEINGRLYLDGAIADSVPYRFMEDKGYDRNVIVLTQARGYRKKNHHMSFLINRIYKDYPALAKAYNDRHEMYNRQMTEIYERADSGQSIVICPPYNPDISRTEKDPYELERVYQMGRKEATKRLDEIRTFLGE